MIDGSHASHDRVLVGTLPLSTLTAYYYFGFLFWSSVLYITPKTIHMLDTQELRRPFEDIIYSHRRPLRNTTVSPSKHMDSHYSTPLSCDSFPSAVAAPTPAFSSPSLALTLMQSMGSMLLKPASRIAASAARPRYECRISVNKL